jgi:ssDNA-binding Zn-finger/Zn-ribbon topoisomerase 1
MAKVCVQCDKKIGLFSKAIEGIYCSYTCRDAGRNEIADNARRSTERLAEAEQLAQKAQAEAAAAAAKAKAEAAVKASCPKCGAAWRFVESGGAGGLNAGSCGKCGLEVSFKAIERCPTCKGMSLVIEADRARCPRCKYRRD